MMNRFIFDPLGEDYDDVMTSGDERAMAAFATADVIVADVQRSMPIIMIISFELNSSGVSFSEICQFLYDNYEEYQIAGLYKSMTDPDSVTATKMQYESAEQLANAKDNADEVNERMRKHSKDK